MKKTPPEPTNAENLEARFDRGDDLIDYFETKKAKPVRGIGRRQNISLSYRRNPNGRESEEQIFTDRFAKA